MTKFRSMTAIVALSAALAAPAFAQTTTGNSTSPATNSPAMHGPATTGAVQTGPSPTAPATMGAASTDANHSTYLTANQDVRASKVIGASVYNDHDQKIGSVDDLLMDQNHDVTQVVLSVGGFLGVDSKLVAVKMDQLQVKPNRLVMAGATKDGLTKMPTYKFASSAM